MRSLESRLSALEKRTLPVRMPVIMKVFDPLTMDDIEERIAEAEREAAARGEQLLAIRIVDPWRNGETGCTA